MHFRVYVCVCMCVCVCVGCWEGGKGGVWKTLLGDTPIDTPSGKRFMDHSLS